MVFTRTTGRPLPITVDFKIPTSDAIYTLRIDNTTVSSAVVIVNGEQIVGPSDFNNQVKLLTRVVILAATNRLSVELRGAPGESLTLQITGVDMGPNLPPDPGEAGKATVQGIDSDHDGVRDDVQRYIALGYPSSARTRSVLRQLSKALQSALEATSVGKSPVAQMIGVANAIECSSYIHGAAAASDITDALIAQIVNTPTRAKAYFTADAELGGLGYKLSPPSQQKTLCASNPDLLPN